MNKKDIFWQTYLNLEKQVLELSNFIFFTDMIESDTASDLPYCHQLDTFSPYIADMLISCCVQIESIAKEIYFDIEGSIDVDNSNKDEDSKRWKDNNPKFDTDCIAAINKKWNTDRKVVLVNCASFSFTKEENRVMKPLKNAYRSKGTYWERAYQAVKHDRWNNLYKGNVKALLQALAALYLLNIYYRKDYWIVKYTDMNKLDYSMGSKIFCVNPPALDGRPWAGNNPPEGDSPFVIALTPDGLARVQNRSDEWGKIVSQYLNAQPEMQEQEFLEQIKLAEKIRKENPDATVDYFYELTCYQLNKKFPRLLSFEQRRKLLLESTEYQKWLLHCNRKDEDITEANIQEKIDHIASCVAFNLKKSLGGLRFISISLNEEISKVYVPG